MVSLLVVGACSTTATITQRDGTVYEGRIISSDCSSMTSRPPATFGDFDVSLRRNEIIDIDHPGNVHATIGAFLVADSLYFALVGLHSTDNRSEIPDGLVNAALAITYATVGLPLLIYGGVVYSQSISAAHAGSSGAPCLAH